VSDPLPELRASDSDRERTVEVLRHAVSDGQLTVDELEERVGAAYAARTRRELGQLTADVSPAPAPAERGSGLAVKEGPGGDRWVMSIMGGHSKRGRWRVAPRCTVLNIMGGSDIDLNDAELSQPVTEINVYSIMGGCEIRVPHGVEVHVSNFAFMGGNDVKLGDEMASPGGPVIRIRLVSIMGGSELKRGRKLSRREKRELRDAERQRELER
jgi:Domain of unknown function (DUF1707)/Cell wall-active antibiotics response 4TMS YvqF